MSSTGRPSSSRPKASSAAAIAPPPKTGLVGVTGTAASQLSRAPRTRRIQLRSGCAAPVLVVPGGSAMAAEGVSGAELIETLAHPADVDFPGTGAVRLE